MQDPDISSNGLVQTTLEKWFFEARSKANAGRIPTYIPRLAAVNRRWLALQVQMSNGQSHTIGVVKQPFALMSVIKPFVLLFLLEHLGPSTVFANVGMLPSDQPFHSVAQLSLDGGFPRNPMINSGAIALADRLPGADGAERCHTLCQWLNRLSGATLTLDQEMLASVRSVGNETNRAIATLIMEAGYLTAIDLALDTYNQICCLSGTVEDLARLGMLLACPHAQISNAHQQIVNALMLTCGLYEASGKWAVQVGLPAKSGVSGALLAVVPRWGAIASYSPALDDAGNSIAGLFLVEKLTRSLHLNIFG
ncbi:MAG: glutaminase A [Leptolyngbyaceae cyanobacterium bins.349]|nr:glutaminase A [Leptolyngbyaceae cyanobacterium bins.349]